MVRILAPLILVAVCVWIYREFAHARRQRAFRLSRDARGRPMPPPHQRVTDAELFDRVRVLRGAVERGELPVDEAAGSLMRFAGGMDLTRARALLQD